MQDALAAVSKLITDLGPSVVLPLLKPALVTLGVIAATLAGKRAVLRSGEG